MTRSKLALVKLASWTPQTCTRASGCRCFRIPPLTVSISTQCQSKFMLSGWVAGKMPVPADGSSDLPPRKPNRFKAWYMLRAMAQGVKKAEVTVALALRYSSGVSKVLNSCASDCHSLGFGSNTKESPPQPLYRARIPCSSVVAGRPSDSRRLNSRNDARLSASLIRAVVASKLGSCGQRKQDQTSLKPAKTGGNTRKFNSSKAGLLRRCCRWVS